MSTGSVGGNNLQGSEKIALCLGMGRALEGGSTQPRTRLLQPLPLRLTPPSACQLSTLEQPQNWRRCPDSRTQYQYHQSPGKVDLEQKDFARYDGKRERADRWPLAMSSKGNTPPCCRRGRGELPKRLLSGGMGGRAGRAFPCSCHSPSGSHPEQKQ